MAPHKCTSVSTRERVKKERDGNSPPTLREPNTDGQTNSLSGVAAKARSLPVPSAAPFICTRAETTSSFFGTRFALGSFSSLSGVSQEEQGSSMPKFTIDQIRQEMDK